ncbi:MAG TPA: DUF2244 domain-containing protein [Burkholderiales bacterium]|nr:DUF2244 domain-containing protein [Burkholderiales bacterium]
MSGEAVDIAAGFTFVARRNNSLPAGGSFLVAGSLVAVILAISCGFAFFGAWPVFPFAGLEILVVGLAFRYMERHAGDYDSVELCGDSLVLETRRGSELDRTEFNRHWVQVRYAPSRGRDRSRLVLRSHGREVDFGARLSGAQRAAVALHLKEHLELHQYKGTLLGDA